MGAADRMLGTGEVVEVRAGKSAKAAYLGSAVVALLAVAVFVFSAVNGYPGEGVLIAAVGWLILGGPLALQGAAQIGTTEFVLTNQRALVVTGLIRRRSMELMRDRIEGVGVDEGAGRLFGFGSLVFTGVGSGRLVVAGVDGPYELRRKVTDRLEAST